MADQDVRRREAQLLRAGLLVGDAGCFVDPISGEGIPLALESAAWRPKRFAALSPRASSVPRRCRISNAVGVTLRPDLDLSDLVVSATRNRRLVKVWIQCLRVIGMTASRDRDYARKLGGILAGLVPSRDGLSADVFVKSLMHGPTFWIEAFRASPASFPTEILRRGADLVSFESARPDSPDGARLDRRVGL